MGAPDPFVFPNRYTPERKDYGFDWSLRLLDGETIVSADVTLLEGDIVISDINNNDTAVTFWLTGGTSVYQRVACTIATNATPPRTFEVQATIGCYP